jgi:hypothetical protein
MLSTEIASEWIDIRNSWAAIFARSVYLRERP